MGSHYEGTIQHSTVVGHQRHSCSWPPSIVETFRTK